MPRLKQKAPPADSRAAFDGLYPGFFAVNDREAGMVDLPGSAAAYFPVGVTGNGIATADQSSAQGVFSSEEAHLVRQLPRERQARYLATAPSKCTWPTPSAHALIPAKWSVSSL